MQPDATKASAKASAGNFIFMLTDAANEKFSLRGLSSPQFGRAGGAAPAREDFRVCVEFHRHRFGSDSDTAMTKIAPGSRATSRNLFSPPSISRWQQRGLRKMLCPTLAARVLRTLPQMNPLAKPSLTQDPAEWLGDAHPLVEQLGSADGLVSLHALAGSLIARPITSLPALRDFLRCYQQQILLPHELPAIRDAYAFAAQNFARELVALDQQLSCEPMLRDFASASRRVGQAQLQRLRPLRDERVVQRYLLAVESGQAHGWHTLVYGMTLVVYSLPMRQGLLGYAQQTTRGFIHAAARPLNATEAECRELFDELCAPLPAAVEALIPKAVAA
jgi:urease accessory protein UreF